MITKIRQYFITNNILDNKSRINVDFLGNKPTEFALEQMPIDPIVETYIDGTSLRQFDFMLLSCNSYSADVMQNIENSTFYETLYHKIEQLNENNVLPNINGIQSIECLNNGSLSQAGTNTARYSIQMRITYLK